MASRGGNSMEVAIPGAYRGLYTSGEISVRVHGRKRSGKAKKGLHHLHGRPRSEKRQPDPFHHKGQARGQ